MKTIYPLLGLISATFIAAGPVPRNARLEARIDIDLPSKLLTRTQASVEPAPGNGPQVSDAEAEKQRLKEEQAGMYQ